jgi:FixJ family two-component response regulator
MTSPPRIVVIVDDDVSFREALAGLVAAFGFRAVAFPSAAAYLESGALQHTACLISDVNMPGVGGIDLYDRLAALEARVPTIFVSGAPDRRTRAAALSRGVTGYLAKPVDPDELVRLILRSVDMDQPPAGF